MDSAVDWVATRKPPAPDELKAWLKIPDVGSGSDGGPATSGPECLLRAGLLHLEEAVARAGRDREARLLYVRGAQILGFMTAQHGHENEFAPLHAHLVISELDADVIALQEVLRPAHTRDPLEALCDDLGLHVAFAVTRVHKRGQLGNAILSRLPITAASVLDISHSRIERRGALGARFSDGMGRSLGVVATHLSLVDRTRERQVKSLLSHPQFESGPSVLLGDMNAWRRSKAIQTLDAELSAHKNSDWPASYPSARPVLALDRVYVRGAKVLEVHAHDTAAARRASDHLPVIAHIEIPHAAPRS